MKRNISVILLSVLSLLLAGCSNSDNHFKTGTEMMLNEHAANHLSVENLMNGREPYSVSKGTLVRVVKDSPDTGKTEVYVLAGTNKGETHTVDRSYLIKCGE